MTARYGRLCRGVPISIHILTQRMVLCICLYGRLWHISIHILAQRMTATVIKSRRMTAFQSTSSHRGWLYQRRKRLHTDDISIHILARRMTERTWSHIITCSISIHILARRMTCPHRHHHHTEPYFNPHPRTEDDWCHRCILSRPKDFNPHPRTEDDFGGARAQAGRRHFNPHPRTEDDENSVNSWTIYGKFQSTSSHGGWPI